MKDNDYSNGYNCSDPITNEIIRLGNAKNKKLFIYNKICLFSDVTIFACNFLAIIVSLLLYLITEKVRNNNFYGGLKEPNIPPDG